MNTLDLLFSFLAFLLQVHCATSYLWVRMEWVSVSYLFAICHLKM